MSCCVIWNNLVSILFYKFLYDVTMTSLPIPSVFLSSYHGLLAVPHHSQTLPNLVWLQSPVLGKLPFSFPSCSNDTLKVSAVNPLCIIAIRVTCLEHFHFIWESLLLWIYSCVHFRNLCGISKLHCACMVFRELLKM